MLVNYKIQVRNIFSFSMKGLNTQSLFLGYLTSDPSDKMLASLHRMINFASCQCANTSIKILKFLIYHAEGAGKTVTYTIFYYNGERGRERESKHVIFYVYCNYY